MENNTDKQVKYDLLLILSPLLPEEKAAEEMERMRQIIEAHGGNIFESDMPKLRPLAYPVAKTWEGKKAVYDQGLFGWMKIEVNSTEIPAIQTEFRTFQHLLRSAITYAYLDVRPVRRIQTEEQPGEPVISSLPPELVNIPPAPRTAEPSQEASAEPKKVMSEAEIDKQIEDLLS